MIRVSEIFWNILRNLGKMHPSHRKTSFLRFHNGPPATFSSATSIIFQCYLNTCFPKRFGTHFFNFGWQNIFFRVVLGSQEWSTNWSTNWFFRHLSARASERGSKRVQGRSGGDLGSLWDSSRCLKPNKNLKNHGVRVFLVFSPISPLRTGPYLLLSAAGLPLRATYTSRTLRRCELDTCKSRRTPISIFLRAHHRAQHSLVLGNRGAPGWPT